MATGGTRKANSPRASERTFIGFTLTARCSGVSGSGCRLTSAPRTAKPGSRKTVPPTIEYSSGGFLLPAAHCQPAATSDRTVRNAARLLLFILLLFIFVIGLVFVVGEVVVILLILVFVFISFVFHFQFQRIEADDVECGSTLVAGERFPFVQIFLIDVDNGVTTRAVDHCVSPGSRLLPSPAAAALSTAQFPSIEDT